MLLLALVAACTGKDGGPLAGDTASDEATFRVVFIADTHVIGPQYECCSESEGLDNDSIMKTPERLAATIARVNAIRPAPDMVFILGDVVHNAAGLSDELDFFLNEDNAYTLTAELLSDFEVPVYPLWGNHDYHVDCDNKGEDERALIHEVFDRLYGVAPYYAVDHKGWRFILANSQLGPTWTAGDPQCATSKGSFGAEQLAWLDAQLSEGLPTISMAHHYLATVQSDENTGENPDLLTVLERHSNLAVAMAGHAHRWIDLEAGDAYPFRHTVLGATRYDDDNFWLLEFEVNGDGYEVLDLDKPRYYTTCADTWSYDGTIGPEEGAVETGDCSG